MDLFRYLMVKNGHNYLKDDDLFSYKLAKGQGGGTYAIFTGTTINATNTRRGKMKLTLKGNTSQTGTPTPSTPIPVNVVSGDNTINVTGKNIFNATANTTTLNGVTFTKNGDGTYTANGTATGFTGFTIGAIDITSNISATYSGSPANGSTGTYSLNLQKNGSVWLTDETGTGQTVTLEANNYYLVRLIVRSGVTVNNLVFKPMVEIGNSKTTYEPYTSNSVLLTLGDKEICKIGNYEDKIFKAIKGNEIYDSLSSEEKNTLNYGKWYLRKAINKVVLNGSENWNNDSGTQGNNYRHNIYYLSRMTIPPANGVSGTYLSNYFVPVNIASDSAELGKFYISEGWIVFPDKNKTYDLAGFKTWLSTHNTIVYYVLATPTYTKITGTLKDELNALQGVRSYDEQTNVSQVNNDLAANLEANILVNE